jgi:hypothetical protein
MGIMEWEQKKIKKISNNSLSYALFGKILVYLMIGSIFSIQFVRFGYYILLISTIFLVHYLNKAFFAWKNNKKLSFGTHVFGFFGVLLLVTFFGVQSPQIPFKIYILILGILLALPAAKELFFD